MCPQAKSIMLDNGSMLHRLKRMADDSGAQVATATAVPMDADDLWTRVLALKVRLSRPNCASSPTTTIKHESLGLTLRRTVLLLFGCLFGWLVVSVAVAIVSLFDAVCLGQSNVKGYERTHGR